MTNSILPTEESIQRLIYASIEVKSGFPFELIGNLSRHDGHLVSEHRLNRRSQHKIRLKTNPSHGMGRVYFAPFAESFSILFFQCQTFCVIVTMYMCRYAHCADKLKPMSGGGGLLRLIQCGQPGSQCRKRIVRHVVLLSDDNAVQ